MNPNVRFFCAELTMSSFIGHQYGPAKHVLLAHRASQSITEHHRASQSITEHHRASQSITEHHRASQSITEHHRASQSITEHHRASQSITEHHRASQWTDITGFSIGSVADGIVMHSRFHLLHRFASNLTISLSANPPAFTVANWLGCFETYEDPKLSQTYSIWPPLVHVGVIL